MTELEKSDYTDPICPFCTEQYQTEPAARRIPSDRVLSKLDEYFAKNDFDGALRHLSYWMEEAKLGGDRRGELLIQNELMGIYRKTGKREEALSAAASALSLLQALGMEDGITAGTVLVNAATVHKAFREAEKAIPLFEKAKIIYEKYLNPEDERLGGLYNNMALAMQDLSRFDEAKSLYQKAISVMLPYPERHGEAAISYLNLADTYLVELGAEAAEAEVTRCVEMAWELLNNEKIPQNGAYAYVCEKCAPIFGYYGYFLYENELKKRSEELYERS